MKSKLKQCISTQLQQPSGWAGRFLLPFIWNRRNRALNDDTLRRLQLRPADHVLEVGFGGGYLLKQILGTLAEGPVCGVDASLAIVRHGRKRFARDIRLGRLHLAHAPVEKLPYATGQFNKVCSVNSIFYWDDFPGGIGEIHRVLAPGGLLVLTFTAQADLDQQGFCPQSVRSFRDETVVARLRDIGFHEPQLEHAADKFRQYAMVCSRK